jgi:hypothetical protein
MLKIGVRWWRWKHHITRSIRQDMLKWGIFYLMLQASHIHIKLIYLLRLYVCVHTCRRSYFMLTSRSSSSLDGGETSLELILRLNLMFSFEASSINESRLNRERNGIIKDKIVWAVNFCNLISFPLIDFTAIYAAPWDLLDFIPGIFV